MQAGNNHALSLSLSTAGRTLREATPISGDGGYRDYRFSCPDAQIVVYFAPNTDHGFTDAILAAAQDSVRNPAVLNISWGGPEELRTQQARKEMNDALSKAADKRITVVVAAGDQGATDGLDDGHLHTDFPSSSPFVLAVGGTKLLTDGDKISSEVVWNDSKDRAGATGGGFSSFFSRPEWQQPLTYKSAELHDRGRGVPDVSANASPGTGYQLLFGGHAQVIGGTTIAAPLWVGLLALTNESLGTRVGYLTPLLYRGLGSSAGFQSVSSGDNRTGKAGGYDAAPGWNPCTGWGSPRGRSFIAP